MSDPSLSDPIASTQEQTPWDQIIAEMHEAARSLLNVVPMWVILSTDGVANPLGSDMSQADERRFNPRGLIFVRVEDAAKLAHAADHAALQRLQMEVVNLRSAFGFEQEKNRQAEAAVQRLQQENIDLRAFIERRGYRRCDIPACNCGSFHGGHAEARLGEIRDVLEASDLETNGKSTLALVKELQQALAQAQREAWEAGFALCRSYGDNWAHFDGEQKERQWQRFLQARLQSSTPQEKA